MYKNILVTGGAGFIGSHIVDKLIDKKYKVIVLDNLSTGLKKYLNPKAQFIKGDVRKISDIEKIFKNNSVDAVLHIAGQPSIITSFTNPEADFATNFTGTVNMINLSLKYKVKRFLYASSMTVYGRAKKLPIKEEDPTVPINYYGVAKYAAERFLHITAEKHTGKTPFNVTSLRMFNVYGPRQSLTNPYQGVLAFFIGNVLRGEPITIYGDGKQSRDFAYIDDIAKIWVTTIENKKSFGKVFNISFGRETSIKVLAHEVIKACGYDPSKYKIVHKEKRPGDANSIKADITKAKTHLTFKPTYSLSKGLKETLKWAKNN